MYKQILTPNLDNDPSRPLYVYQGGGILTDWYGWCLAVVAASFGARGSSYSAKTAWQANGTKHWDRDIPEGLYVPLWYEGGQYGHVVIGFREGNQLTIYSSPYTHKPTFDVFRGELNYILDFVGRVYGVGGFSGWTETVLNSTVLAWKEPSQTPPEPPETQESDEIVQEPIPTPETPSAPSDEPTEPNNNEKGEETMATIEPVPEQDQQEALSIIQEASKGFNIPNWLKITGYILGDIFIYGGIASPFVFNMMQASDLTAFGTYLSGLLMATGVFILTVFKLIKR